MLILSSVLFLSSNDHFLIQILANFLMTEAMRSNLIGVNDSENVPTL